MISERRMLKLLCSTDFFWGSDITDAASYLVKSGCEGVVISTEPPHYFPSLLHRDKVRALRDFLRSSGVTVVVKSPETDVNIFSSNPYISEASQRSIEDSINLSLYLNADFTVVRPSCSPVRLNYGILMSKLQKLMSGVGRESYIALELAGEGSGDIARMLRDRRIGLIYVDGMSPEDLLRSERLVGLAIYFRASQPLKIIPGMKTNLPYLLIYPAERRMHRAEDFRRIVFKVKSWRDSLP